MKLLHTADWHLGKRLDHLSRLEEQQAVLAELCELAEAEAVDAVLIAGDLFDQINPSIEALELFYWSLKRLSADGRRAVIGIAGNHDSPDRIEAPVPLAQECGIILLGYPHSQVRPFTLDSGLAVLHSDSGFLELKLPRCEAPLRLLLTPYANEIRLKRYLGADNSEAALREVLQASWQKLANLYCDSQGVNVLMSHLFVLAQGGEKPEEPEGEKPILTLGGAQEIYLENFPPNIQYVALGHLHRHQIVQSSPYPVVYSGSPLAYSMSEAGQEKQVVLLEASPGQPVEMKSLPLTQGRRLARMKFESVEAAIDWLKTHPQYLVELTLVSDEYVTADQRKALFQSHTGIVNLIPQLRNPDAQSAAYLEVDLGKSLSDLFVDYFQYKHGQAPNERLTELLREVLAEDEPS